MRVRYTDRIWLCSAGGALTARLQIDARDCVGHGTNLASIAAGFDTSTGSPFEDSEGLPGPSGGWAGAAPLT